MTAIIHQEPLVEKLTRLANDPRYSNEFIGLVVRRHLRKEHLENGSNPPSAVER